MVSQFCIICCLPIILQQNPPMVPCFPELLTSAIFPFCMSHCKHKLVQYISSFFVDVVTIFCGYFILALKFKVLRFRSLFQCIRCLRQTCAFAQPGDPNPSNEREAWWISRWSHGCPMCGGTWVRVVQYQKLFLLFASSFSGFTYAVKLCTYVQLICDYNLHNIFPQQMVKISV